MKKVLLPLFLLILAIACGQDTYTIKGSIENPEALPEDAKVYVSDRTDPQLPVIDSAVIENGSFTLKGKADPEKMYNIYVGYPDHSVGDPRWATSFIPEKGSYDIILRERLSTVSGGKINEALNEFKESIQEITDDFRKKVADFGDDEEEKAQALYDETMEKMNELSRETIKKNANNYISLIALQNIIYDIDLEDLENILDHCGSFVKENDRIKRIHDCKVAEEATSEGKAFVDFSGKTPEGADVKLSDFVGKGKWVLADFWASWCGPCMREIPNIKKTHETLSGDKFTVLGIAVWETNGDNTKSADRMKEKEMTWPQIFVGDDKTPTDVYGIVGIPTMILFAPDGTICKRGEDLRGEKMMETVRDIINQ
jgi:thiol-disulfide isomerase/thioredoxin/gas vesicle protein